MAASGVVMPQDSGSTQTSTEKVAFMGAPGGHQEAPSAVTAAFTSLRIAGVQAVSPEAPQRKTPEDDGRECLHAAVDAIHCRRCCNRKGKASEQRSSEMESTGCLHAAVDAVHCRRCTERKNKGCQPPVTTPSPASSIPRAKHSRAPTVPWPDAPKEIRREYPYEPVAYFRASKVRDRFQYLWHYNSYEGVKRGTPSRPKGDFFVEREVKEVTWAQRRKDKDSLFTPSRWESAARHILEKRGKQPRRSWVKRLQLRGASPEDWRVCALQRRKMRRHRLFEARKGVKGDGRRVMEWWQPQSEAVAKERWEEAAADVKSPSEVKRTDFLETPGLLAMFCRRFRSYSMYGGS